MADTYFFIYPDNDPKHPLLQWDQSSRKFAKCKPVDIEEGGQVQLTFCEPYPAVVELADYLPLPRPVVSEPLKCAIEEVRPTTVQFLKSIIRDPRDDQQQTTASGDDYYFMHISQKIECVDLDRSKFKRSKHGWIISFDKIVLDGEELSSIPLQDRLIFCMAEERTFRLYHESVVEAMQSTGATGFRAVEASIWSPAEEFGPS